MQKEYLKFTRFLGAFFYTLQKLNHTEIKKIKSGDCLRGLLGGLKTTKNYQKIQKAKSKKSHNSAVFYTLPKDTKRKNAHW